MLCYLSVIEDLILLQLDYLSNGCLELFTSEDDYSFTLMQTVCSSGQMDKEVSFTGLVLIKADEGAVYDIRLSRKEYSMF